jgi:hypothetical protein
MIDHGKDEQVMDPRTTNIPWRPSGNELPEQTLEEGQAFGPHDVGLIDHDKDEQVMDPRTTNIPGRPLQQELPKQTMGEERAFRPRDAGLLGHDKDDQEMDLATSLPEPIHKTDNPGHVSGHVRPEQVVEEDG